MYKLPSDFDGNSFVGREVELVCFSQNQLTLHFDSQISLTLEGAFSFGRVGWVELDEVHEVPVSSSNLMQLAGLKVVRADIREQSTLILVFEGNLEFRCYDTAANFESYHITIGGRTITV